MEKYAGYDEKLNGGRTLGEELLTPTRIYHESLKVSESCTVNGMCHVTGGRLLNFKRLCGYGFRFDTPITPPAIRVDPEDRGHLHGRDVPHVQYGHGICVCRAGKERPGIRKMGKGAQVVGEVVEEPGAWMKDIEIT